MNCKKGFSLQITINFIVRIIFFLTLLAYVKRWKKTELFSKKKADQAERQENSPGDALASILFTWNQSTSPNCNSSLSTIHNNNLLLCFTDWLKGRD